MFLSNDKGFRKKHLIGLESYNILLFDDKILIVLKHDKYIKVYEFPVSNIPSYHESLVLREKAKKDNDKDKSQMVMSLTEEFINKLKNLM